MSAEVASIFRTVVTSANFVSVGRPHLAFAVEEVCKRMIIPSEKGLGSPIRTWNELDHQDKRAAQLFVWQLEEHQMAAFADANHAV